MPRELRGGMVQLPSLRRIPQCFCNGRCTYATLLSSQLGTSSYALLLGASALMLGRCWLDWGWRCAAAVVPAVLQPPSSVFSVYIYRPKMWHRLQVRRCPGHLRLQLTCAGTCAGTCASFITEKQNFPPRVSRTAPHGHGRGEEDDRGSGNESQVT
jgi:hypothetical protein